MLGLQDMLVLGALGHIYRGAWYGRGWGYGLVQVGTSLGWSRELCPSLLCHI